MTTLNVERQESHGKMARYSQIITGASQIAVVAKNLQRGIIKWGFTPTTPTVGLLRHHGLWASKIIVSRAIKQVWGLLKVGTIVVRKG